LGSYFPKSKTQKKGKPPDFSQTLALSMSNLIEPCVGIQDLILMLDRSSIPLHFLFLALAAAAWTQPAFTSEHRYPSLRSIEISTDPLGPIPTYKTTITIRKVGGIFRRSGKTMENLGSRTVTIIFDQEEPAPPSPGLNQKTVHLIANATVPAHQVEALVRAMREPALSAPTLENLGITAQWLALHAEAQIGHTGALGEVNTSAQQDFFRKSYSDPVLIQKLLPNVVNARWTDDAPGVNVVVSFSDGSKIIATTNAQPAFMLPWSIEKNGHTDHTYNAHISQAVASLLPKEDIYNRRRLAGDDLDNQLRRAVEPTIKSQWQLIGAEARTGFALAQIRKKYIVRRAEVSDHHGLAYGVAWKDNIPRQDNLQADVRLPSFPINLVVATAFPIRDGEAQGIDYFLQHAGEYERLVLTNPWLMRSLLAHRDLGAWLHFGEDASLSEKALKIFTADMHELGKDNLATHVAAHRKEVALLNYYGNQLILFPDHHAIIWRWGPYRDLFQWPASSIHTERCTEYSTSTEGCAGVIIDADGSLRKYSSLFPFNQ
jgi:hypothetical protein